MPVHRVEFSDSSPRKYIDCKDAQDAYEYAEKTWGKSAVHTVVQASFTEQADAVAAGLDFITLTTEQ